MTIRVEMRRMKTRLGKFAVIKVGQAILITPCDTRMRILEVLSNGEQTSEEITKETGVTYSCVMDHMDLLEQLGVVKTMLKRDGGRRRIYFHLNEDLRDGIDNLFQATPKKGRGQSAKQFTRAQASVPL